MLPSLRLLLLFLAACAPTWAAAGGRLTVAVKDSKGTPVADAVVALVPLDAPVPPPSAEPREIVQQQQQFSRYVTVVQTGSQVQFPNRDTVQHHVYSLSKPKKFELPLYSPGQAESVAFDVSGMVTLGCNIHDWMVAYLYVVPTPYFAQTGDGGDAAVTAPAGRYQLELLHPRLGTSMTTEITLAEGTAVERAFALTLKPDRRIRRAPDTKAGAYR